MTQSDDALLGESPAALEIRRELGRWLRASGRRAEAERQWRDALAACRRRTPAADATGRRVLAQLALALWQDGRGAEAEALMREEWALRQAAGLDSSFASAMVGVCLMVQGRAAEAERELSSVEALPRDGRAGPPWVGAHVALAAARLKCGRAREAAEGLGRLDADAADLPPEGRWAIHSLRAAALTRLGRHDEAVRSARKMLAASPRGRAESLTALGVTLAAAGSGDAAEARLREAVALARRTGRTGETRSARAMIRLALTLAEAGRPDAAVTAEAESAAEALALADRPVFAARCEAGDTSTDLAIALALSGRAERAWAVAEAGFARRAAGPLAWLTPLEREQALDRAARLYALDDILDAHAALPADGPTPADRSRLAELRAEAAGLAAESAELSRRAVARGVAPLAEVQAALGPADALAFRLDCPESGRSLTCVVLRTGPPVWVRQPADAFRGVTRVVAVATPDLAAGPGVVVTHAASATAFARGAGASR